MCGGVLYQQGTELKRVYFPNPKAMLPVRTRQGTVEFLPWGRRKGQAGTLPPGGWARLDAIQRGRWDAWFPIPVKLPIISFMEKDIEGNSHWFDLIRGQFIQGLVARQAGKRLVYVVTVTPEMPDAVHERWPRILSDSG